MLNFQQGKLNRITTVQECDLSVGRQAQQKFKYGDEAENIIIYLQLISIR
jgi:hypothetical protein